MQAHDFVTCRLVPLDTVAAVGGQLLDQLGTRGLLDQHFVGPEQALLLAHGAFELRLFEAPLEQAGVAPGQRLQGPPNSPSVKMPAALMGSGRCGTDGLRTPRWRELDSKFRFLCGRALGSVACGDKGAGTGRGSVSGPTADLKIREVSCELVALLRSLPSVYISRRTITIFFNSKLIVHSGVTLLLLLF